MKVLHYFFYFSSITLASCLGKNDNLQSQQSTKINESITDDSARQPIKPVSVNVSVKTFEVTDSTGKSQGWGYDIFLDGKRAIHQPIIPAIAGNKAFKTEADAKKTGLFAVEKMNLQGSLPTLLVKELDSLGVL